MKNSLFVTALIFTINFFDQENAIQASESKIPSLFELTFIEELGGTTDAKKMYDHEGHFWVYKSGDSPEHCFNEYQANRAYAVLDVPVPAGEFFTTTKGSNTKTYLINAWINGTPLWRYLEKVSQEKRTAVIGELHKHFVADCMLGNWDAIGMSQDNIIVDKKGIPWRIDNGGALEFRAQGGRKGKEWGPEIKELSTLRDPRSNSVTAEIFKDISDQQILQQIEAIEQKQEALFAAVAEQLHPILKERFYYLIQYKNELDIN